MYITYEFSGQHKMCGRIKNKNMIIIKLKY